MYIFIDDERNPDDVKWVKMPKPKEWHVCRSYKGFVNLLLNSTESPTFVSFDHDLGLPKDGTEEKTGAHCATALVEICCDKHWTMPKIQVHSQNPVGKANILGKIDSGKRWVEINSSKGFHG